MKFEVEGLYQLEIDDKNHLIWSQALQVVTTPIIINNNKINYFLLVSQSRFPFGGKVSIEINRGFLQNNVQEGNRWIGLIDRKFPYLKDELDIIKVVDIGSYWQQPDFCDFQMPMQAIFTKTKEPIDIAVLKKKLKTHHEYYNEPKSGPPLHNNEPNIKTVDEVKSRLYQIFANPEKTSTELYINELYSMTALGALFNYLEEYGYPY